MPALQFLHFDHTFETVSDNDCFFYEDIKTTHTQTCRLFFSTNLDVVTCGKDARLTLRSAEYLWNHSTSHQLTTSFYDIFHTHVRSCLVLLPLVQRTNQHSPAYTSCKIPLHWSRTSFQIWQSIFGGNPLLFLHLFCIYLGFLPAQWPLPVS